MNETLKYILLAVLAMVPVGATIRVIICRIQMTTDPEQESLYKREAKNVIIYAVIAECAWSILTLVYSYLT